MKKFFKKVSDLHITAVLTAAIIGGCFDLADASDPTRGNRINPFQNHRSSDSSLSEDAVSTATPSTSTSIADLPEKASELLLEGVLHSLLERKAILQASSSSTGTDLSQYLDVLDRAQDVMSYLLFLVRREIRLKHPALFRDPEAAKDPRYAQMFHCMEEIIAMDPEEKEVFDIQWLILMEIPFLDTPNTSENIAVFSEALDRLLKKHPEKASAFWNAGSEAQKALEQTDKNGFDRSHETFFGLTELMEQGRPGYTLERVKTFLVKEGQRLLHECQDLVFDVLRFCNPWTAARLGNIMQELENLIAFFDTAADIDTIKRRLYTTFISQGGKLEGMHEGTLTEYDLAHLLIDDMTASINKAKARAASSAEQH